MAVPPVLSSTSAEYSLQELEGCTMRPASVECHKVRVSGLQREWDESAFRVMSCFRT
jgi:hypothetical protein